MADLKRWRGLYWVVYAPEMADHWTIGEFDAAGNWFVIGVESAIPEEYLIIGEFISPPRDYQTNKSEDGK